MDQSIILERNNRQNLVYVVVQNNNAVWNGRGVNPEGVRIVAVFSNLRDANNFINSRNTRNLVVQAAELDPFYDRVGSSANDNYNYQNSYIS